MVWYKRIVKQYKKGKGFQKVINLSVHDEFQHMEEVAVISMDEFDNINAKVRDRDINAAEDESNDNKIESLESIITEKDSKITILTDQIQSLEKDKVKASDKVDELSDLLENKNDALIKSVALLTAYENQSWIDKVFNKKPKLKEAMDIYLADNNTVDVSAEVKDASDKE